MNEQEWTIDGSDDKLRILMDDTTIHILKERSEQLFSLMSYYKCAMMEVETKLNVLNEEFSLQYDRNPINSIKSRLKSFPSIRNKLQSRGIPLTLNNMEQHLHDIAGIRVICSFLDDIYLLADCLLRQDDITLVERKDYIMSPKPNGYRSLHLIVEIPIFLKDGKKNMKVELQLRTIAMDCWASLEHQLNYKKESHPYSPDADELLECAKLSAELDKRMNQLKQTVFQQ